MGNYTDKFKQVPTATTVLIVVNVVVFLAGMLVPAASLFLSTLSVSASKVLYLGQWWTLVTSMFLHGGIMHILCNMFSLYYLGCMCEKVFGKVRFLIMYFACGIAGNLAFIAVHYFTNTPLQTAVGASGAIFGLFGAYGYLIFRERKNPKIFVRPTTKADIEGFIGVLVLNLIIGFAPGSNIANEAHLGGMVCGFILGAVFYAMIARKAAPFIAQAQARYNQNQPQQVQHQSYSQNNQSQYKIVRGGQYRPPSDQERK